MALAEREPPPLLALAEPEALEVGELCCVALTVGVGEDEREAKDEAEDEGVGDGE